MQSNLQNSHHEWVERYLNDPIVKEFDSRLNDLITKAPVKFAMLGDMFLGHVRDESLDDLITKIEEERENYIKSTYPLRG